MDSRRLPNARGPFLINLTRFCKSCFLFVFLSSLLCFVLCFFLAFVHSPSLLCVDPEDGSWTWPVHDTVSCLSQNTLIGHKWGKPNTLFLYVNIWMLLSGLGWIFLLFCCFRAASILGLSLIINYSLWHFRFRMSIGVSILIPVFLPFSKSNN